MAGSWETQNLCKCASDVRQDFLDISNPKAVLEMTLRGFSCLTRGDCICLHYNNKKYYIDITEAKPQVRTLPSTPVSLVCREYTAVWHVHHAFIAVNSSTSQWVEQ